MIYCNCRYFGMDNKIIFQFSAILCEKTWILSTFTILHLFIIIVDFLYVIYDGLFVLKQVQYFFLASLLMFSHFRDILTVLIKWTFKLIVRLQFYLNNIRNFREFRIYSKFNYFLHLPKKEMFLHCFKAYFDLNVAFCV